MAMRLGYAPPIQSIDRRHKEAYALYAGRTVDMKDARDSSRRLRAQ